MSEQSAPHRKGGGAHRSGAGGRVAAATSGERTTGRRHVFGAPGGGSDRSGGAATASLGAFRATDGTTGAPAAVDLDAPHVALVVGKRGSGKSHTLGVLAEELARAAGVAPVVVDPMGEFAGLTEGVPAAVRAPRVRAAALTPRSWCALLDLDPAGAVGGLVWRAAARADSFAEMRALVESCSAEAPVARAAANHLRRAAGWGVFAPDGLGPADLRDGAATVIDCGDLAAPATGAVCHAVATGLYESARADDTGPLPWLLLDEAARHVDGAAAPALRTLLTRGRTPGVSVVLATQRPDALPAVAVSQADLLVAHRLTTAADVSALERARPTYLRGSVGDRLPRATGAALVVDEATERAATVVVRERDTPHGGTTPRASDRAGVASSGDEQVVAATRPD
ncbi:MAG: ATP-binding protein [Halobacteriaceae archaeon]